jgi:DNA-binding transcriptional ArsR family regulator
MTIILDMAGTAALVGDPARANMLSSMMDGRAHTATELAHLSGVSAPTASGHLAKLTEAGMIQVLAQGRHRYYRLASADVARLLESIMTFASDPRGRKKRATPRIDPALRRARTCYDHIAGELGVAIADRLAETRLVELSADVCVITDTGFGTLKRIGIASTELFKSSRRPACRVCLDWSERRPHLSGMLGAAILNRALQLELVKRRHGSRALSVEGEFSKVLSRLGFSEQ